ncbi:MAG: hypothetical protein CVV64_03760 [Candidatus Wallbacteria bacterium HGW-Wallbacteria-1]|jgi:prepilin-type N-terminal cleavage/methylation domain-containing protein|uniref:Type II secretion system protein GspG C-terminal domain-containing protein n=1 Tax=Candidatus Wallbacteria bacterium HGW-Wallbacteria-1 TaxID=2013854 RepID=A0A2N1PTZ1_9BACT|nr:MAG: hypothetical protein CVV64_03760 [Candidatus Wallbacteria bacterium HGW-Wallbacteria-1]
MKQAKNGEKAFTLVELMIVIAVIGILSSIALPNMMQANKKAKTRACKANLSQLQRTIEVYNTENNRYPDCQDADSLERLLKSYFVGGVFPKCPNKIPYLLIQPIPGEGTIQVLCPEHGVFDD